MIMFIDREAELEKLKEIASSEKAELVLLYGRRRIGKSKLLMELAKQTGALYLLSDLSEGVLDIFSKQIGEEFVKFRDWDDFFDFILRSKPRIIIIDEFQYLYQTNKAWPSILQRWWEKLKETDKKIILCGSLISTVYRIAVGYGSALYGRKTREIQITPMRFRHISGFLPEYGIERLVEAYSVLGGVPRYLEEFDSRRSVKENIEMKILDKTSFLYNEPFNLLFEEFRDPAPYVSILQSVAQGYTRFADIAVASSVGLNKLSKYMMVLERAGIIGKDLPATERRIKSKITRYRLRDEFYKFWFRFVFENRAMLEQERVKDVSEVIGRDFNSYVGKSFEVICRELVLDMELFKATGIGSWWRKDSEIDIVAVNNMNKAILFGECKWKSDVEASEVLDDLRKKAALVEWNGKHRKEIYVLFAKSFNNAVERENVKLLDLHRIAEVLGLKNEKLNIPN